MPPASDDATCVFCDIIDGRTRHPLLLWETFGATSFYPLNPVSRGHILVVPTRHGERITDFTTGELGACMALVNVIAGAPAWEGRGRDFNVIQSNGPDATQTINHVHFHLVPREHGDGLKLPWSDQAETSSREAAP